MKEYQINNEIQCYLPFVVEQDLIKTFRELAEKSNIKFVSTIHPNLEQTDVYGIVCDEKLIAYRLEFEREYTFVSKEAFNFFINFISQIIKYDNEITIDMFTSN